MRRFRPRSVRLHLSTYVPPPRSSVASIRCYFRGGHRGTATVRVSNVFQQALSTLDRYQRQTKDSFYESDSFDLALTPILTYKLGACYRIMFSIYMVPVFWGFLATKHCFTHACSAGRPSRASNSSSQVCISCLTRFFSALASSTSIAAPSTGDVAGTSETSPAATVWPAIGWASRCSRSLNSR